MKRMVLMIGAMALCLGNTAFAELKQITLLTTTPNVAPHIDPAVDNFWIDSCTSSCSKTTSIPVTLEQLNSGNFKASINVPAGWARVGNTIVAGLIQGAAGPAGAGCVSQSGRPLFYPLLTSKTSLTITVVGEYQVNSSSGRYYPICEFALQ